MWYKPILFCGLEMTESASGKYWTEVAQNSHLPLCLRGIVIPLFYVFVITNIFLFMYHCILTFVWPTFFPPPVKTEEVEREEEEDEEEQEVTTAGANTDGESHKWVCPRLFKCLCRFVRSSVSCFTFITAPQNATGVSVYI